MPSRAFAVMHSSRRSARRLEQEKRLGQLRKYPNQSIVGFRYVGMGWWPYTKGGERVEKVKKDKRWGAEMSVENTGSGLAK